MVTSTKYDLVVIGGGPAGYAAAIRAGQLGKKVICIEMERAGGTCLNWGCIPSKALLKAAEFYQAMQHAMDFGFKVGKVKIDFAKVMARSRGVANTMGQGIEFLFRKNKVEYIVGQAQVSTPGMVEIIAGERQGEFFATENILLATGCKPKSLPGVAVDGTRVLTSREMLAAKKQPQSIAILGAGAIGVEFAYFLSSLGTTVHLVEMMPQILPVEDTEVAMVLERALAKQGIQVYTNTKAEHLGIDDKGVNLQLKCANEGELSLDVETVLVAVGVSPNVNGLLSAKVSLEYDQGFIQVNDHYQTNLPGIYAAGDVIGPPWLAHVATYEALQAVGGIFGIAKPKRAQIYPGCTYCQPQVASIGLTEQAAKEKNLDYTVGKFPFIASGKAVAINQSEGFVKIIADKHRGEILGAHIVGYEATEMIAEFCLAMSLEATVDEIYATIHAHPTFAEATMEAAAVIKGTVTHI